jgi:hypothetical protein
VYLVTAIVFVFDVASGALMCMSWLVGLIARSCVHDAAGLEYDGVEVVMAAMSMACRQVSRRCGR